MLILMFIIGTLLGSFYNVVGYRLPKEESIVYPPSHCPKCNHKLTVLELIPIISYIIQKGRCKNCKEKISMFYPIFELITGILFSLSYYVFGPTQELIIVLTFISLLIIITISDYHYMIIPDEVLIFFGIILSIEILIINGPKELLTSIIHGIVSFIFMLLLKKFGDFLFKKESMGGGDIKLMFIIGLALSSPVAILSVFVGSLIGLPTSIVLIKKNTDHIIPFGPFLAAGAVTLLLLKIDLQTILNFYYL